MISGKPGLVPQISGRLTKRRVIGATIYADHYSNLLYIHLVQSMSGEDTQQSKWAYERITMMHHVKIKQYHSENGHFGEKDFCNACEAQGQKFTFCGVGAHHQNRIAENRTKLLALKAQTMLLYADRHWHEYITTILWSYALKLMEIHSNKFDINEDGLLPEEKITGIKSIPTLNDHNTQGCLIYVLDA
eukprot:3201509-Ditylum_brightwellii.AAC.1